MADLSEDFKYQKVEKEKCEAMSNECMIIKTGETFDTSIGRRKQPLKDGNQRMVLANDKSVGHLDLTLNVAHELGHAWGLLHPHQNPIYWRHTNGDTGAPSDLVVFDADDPDQFMCENLKDYGQAMRTAATRGGGDPNQVAWYQRQMCTSYIYASGYGFRGGMNWIPWDPRLESVSLDAPIDWTSIMLYPSGAGGDLIVGGGRRNVLLKPDGTAIPTNTRPSTGDVQGINYLYNWKPKSKWPLHSRKDLAKIRKNDGDSTCNVYQEPPN